MAHGFRFIPKQKNPADFLPWDGWTRAILDNGSYIWLPPKELTYSYPAAVTEFMPFTVRRNNV
jgi:hypothetical protein